MCNGSKIAKRRVLVSTSGERDTQQQLRYLAVSTGMHILEDLVVF